MGEKANFITHFFFACYKIYLLDTTFLLCVINFVCAKHYTKILLKGFLGVFFAVIKFIDGIYYIYMLVFSLARIIL